MKEAPACNKAAVSPRDTRGFPSHTSLLIGTGLQDPFLTHQTRLEQNVE